jgi:ribosomal protein L33
MTVRMGKSLLKIQKYSRICGMRRRYTVQDRTYGNVFTKNTAKYAVCGVYTPYKTVRTGKSLLKIQKYSRICGMRRRYTVQDRTYGNVST